jgi:hypothetical protein
MATPQVTPNWYVPAGPARPAPRTNAMPPLTLNPPPTRLLSGNTRGPTNRVSSSASTVVNNNSSKGGSKTHRRKSHRRKSHKRKTHRRR